MARYLDTPSDQQDIGQQDAGDLAISLTPTPLTGYAAVSHGDDDRWQARICEAFGTRRMPAATAFLKQLITLCAVSYDVTNQRWKPSEIELNFAVDLIASIKPRNQMEAALAAQMVAVHFMQMRMSARTLGEQDIEARDAAVAAKLARTFAIQLATLAQLRGRGTARQSIKVRKDNHVHYHVHRGDGETGAEPRAPRAIAEDAGVIAQLPQVPGQDSFGSVVPIPSRARRTAV